MINSIAIYIGNTLSRALTRLYLLMENNKYLELENGLPIELED